MDRPAGENVPKGVQELIVSGWLPPLKAWICKRVFVVVVGLVGIVVRDGFPEMWVRDGVPGLADCLTGGCVPWREVLEDVVGDKGVVEGCGYWALRFRGVGCRQRG